MREPRERASAGPEGSFGDLLRHHRLTRGWTQAELAERASLSTRAVSDLERGIKQRPQRETVRLLTDALTLTAAARTEFEIRSRGLRALPAAPSNAMPVPLTVEALPSHLPVPLTPLLGREGELAAMTALIREEAVRLLTITGPGGAGKTRLAIAVATALRHAFPDGVVFVSLAALNDPTLLPATVAHALGLHEAAAQSSFAQVTGFLRTRALLLVLDNFEQLIAAATMVADLLGACPMMRVIVTSREALRVRGEHEFALAPLPVPDAQADLDALAESAAVALFCQRARAMQRTFTLNAGNAAAVRAICARLDGLPLAIELAAAHMKVLSPSVLLTRLERSLDLLTGGARDLPSRQQTMRGTIRWSYELLTDPEQRLFRWLAVFTGGCTFAAAEAMAAEHDRADTLDGLTALVNKSLLQCAGVDDLRFVMLETIREYGREMLVAHGERDRAQQWHAAYYLALAEEAEPALGGAEQGAWIARLDAEHENLRAALAWARGHCDVERGLRLAAALGDFWHARGFINEGQAWLDAMLALADSSEGREHWAGPRAKALTTAGKMARLAGDYSHATAQQEEALRLQQARGDIAGSATTLDELGLIAYRQGAYERARALLEESVALARTIDDRARVAEALKHLGLVAWMQGEYARATALHTESLAHDRALGNQRGIARSLNNLAIIANTEGDHARALPLHEESLRIQRQIGDKTGIALSLDNLAHSVLELGDGARALLWAEESLAIRREIGDRLLLANSLLNLGDFASKEGNYARARECLIESMRHYRALDAQSGVARALEGMARVAVATGDFERAARLFGSATALAERRDATLPAQIQADHAVNARAIAETRAILGDTEFAAAWQSGAALSLDAAIAIATEG